MNVKSTVLPHRDIVRKRRPQLAGSRTSLSDRVAPNVVAAALVAVSIVTIVLGEHQQLATLGGVSFLVNLILAAVLVVKVAADGRVTSALVHVLAVWLTMIHAPFAAFLNGRFSSLNFFGVEFSEERILLANLLVLAWIIVFVFSYTSSEKRAPYQRQSVIVNAPGVWVQIVCAIWSLWYLFERLGLGVLTRKAYEEGIGAESVSEYILVSVPLRMVSIFALAVALLVLAGKQLSRMHRFILIAATAMLAIATLAINNPLAAPRYFTGSVVIGFLFLFWFRHGMKAGQFVVLVMIVVFGIFPIDFGRYSVDITDAISDVEYSVEAAFGRDNFRTYETLIAALAFLEKNDSVYGRQLAGNLLFWIPRSVWADKPVGTGTFLAGQFGESFTNIACPVQCEAIVNFGLVGIPILAFAFALVFRKLDAWYWNRQYRDQSAITTSVLLYPFLLGNVFFLTRGDLLSPLAYSVTMVLGVLPLFAASWVKRMVDRIASRVQ